MPSPPPWKTKTNGEKKKDWKLTRYSRPPLNTRPSSGREIAGRNRHNTRGRWTNLWTSFCCAAVALQRHSKTALVSTDGLPASKRQLDEVLSMITHAWDGLECQTREEFTHLVVFARVWWISRGASLKDKTQKLLLGRKPHRIPCQRVKGNHIGFHFNESKVIRKL